MSRLAMMVFSFHSRKPAIHVIINPCPASPNITAKRKGKVMTVNGAANRQMKLIKTANGNVTTEFFPRVKERFEDDTPGLTSR